MRAAEPVDFSAAPVRGDFDVRWIHGARRRRQAAGPSWGVHALLRRDAISRG